MSGSSSVIGMEDVRHTSHLNAPCKPVQDHLLVQVVSISFGFSISHEDQREILKTLSKGRGTGYTHCNPTRLNVNSAMRIDSVLPLIDGVPTHDAACGIAAMYATACGLLSLQSIYPSSQSSDQIALPVAEIPAQILSSVPRVLSPPRRRVLAIDDYSGLLLLLQTEVYYFSRTLACDFSVTAS